MRVERVSLDGLVGARREERAKGEAHRVHHVRVRGEPSLEGRDAALRIGHRPDEDGLVSRARIDELVRGEHAPDACLVAGQRDDTAALARSGSGRAP